MMMLKGTIVTVADGEKLNLFRNAGYEAAMKLVAMTHEAIDSDRGTSMGRRRLSNTPEENCKAAPRHRGIPL